MRDQNSKPNCLKKPPDDLDSIRPPWGEKLAPMSPFKVPLAGFLLFFQYIAVTKYYFSNLQSMGVGNVIDAPVKQLESDGNINKVT